MSSVDRLTSLMSVAEFSGVDLSTRATLAAAMAEERFAAGTSIMEEGEYGDRLYVLCEGEVEISQPEMPSRIQQLGPGTLLGELAFFVERTRTASVRAATDCTLLSLSYTSFREFLLANPDAALRLAERLAHKLRATEAELAAARQVWKPGSR